MSDLRIIIRIKTMATAAASSSEQLGPEEGREIAGAYERLREEARALTVRAGWGDDEAFDRELPSLGPEAPQAGVRIGGGMGGDEAREAVRRGTRARVLLGQLAAWAAGYQEAFEIEERMKAEASARASERAGGRSVGFG